MTADAELAGDSESENERAKAFSNAHFNGFKAVPTKNLAVRCDDSAVRNIYPWQLPCALDVL